MKSIIFITFLTASFIFSTSIFSQKLQTVEFDKDRYNHIDPIILYVTPGDSIQFVTTNGDFAIYIYQAIFYLQIDQPNLPILITDSNPESQVYVVKDVDGVVAVDYIFYSITNNKWPNAPPKIIIRVH